MVVVNKYFVPSKFSRSEKFQVPRNLFVFTKSKVNVLNWFQIFDRFETKCPW